MSFSRAVQTETELILIDGSSQFYRAFFQLRTLINSKGMPTGAIYGFTNIIMKLIKEFRPKYMAVAWDSHKRFRDEKFPNYKAKRRETPDDLKIQIPYIKKIVSAYGIPSFEIEGFEADDIIATIVSKVKDEVKGKIIITTSDKDIMQIVSDKVFVFDPRADEGKGKIYGPEDVKEKFGVRPEQIPDYLALVGDTSDNIPGAKGIGPEGAKKLLEKFSSVEDIYSSLHLIEPKYKKSLLGEKQTVLLWKELVKLKTLDIEISLKDLKIVEPNIDTLIEIFKELEFASYLRELAENIPEKLCKFNTKDFFLVDSPHKIEEIIEKIQRFGYFAIDVETTPDPPIDAKLIGLSIAFEDKSAYYIDMKSEEGFSYLQKIKEYIQDPAYGKIGQNIKFDMLILKKYGIELRGIKDDTMIQAWMLNPDRTKVNLDELSLIYLGHKTTKYTDITLGGKISLEKIPTEKVKDYCCEDSITSLEISRELTPYLREKGLEEPYRKIELELIPVLVDMEFAGVKVNVDFLREFGNEIKKELEKLTKRIYDVAGVRFNLDSPQQLASVLFNKMKIQLEEMKKTKKTKMYSTDNEVLKEIASRGHEIGDLLLRYRSLKKLLSTYIEPLPRLIKKTGRIHTSFNQTKTATGRLSSSEPNLQNIPNKGEEGEKIREGFIAEEGNLLVSADYSQIELRVLAHLSGDPLLKDAFLKGKDIHTEVASSLFNLSPENIGKDERRIAKTVNFGIIYGISAHGLKTQAGLSSRHDAQKLIDSYFQKYKSVKVWRENIVRQAEVEGFVRTISGRIRYIPELKSDDTTTRSEGERRAVNTPVQGSAADIMKTAMIRIWKRLKKELKGAKIIIQVHDEIITETPEKEVNKVAKIIEEEMKKVGEDFSLSVPLEVKVSIGKKWSEL